MRLKNGVILRWYDHWLKGIDNGVEQNRPVRIFVMGIDEWREEESWPLPDTQYRSYYLHSRGRANTASGDGVLSAVLPSDEPEDTSGFDPHHPIPTMGGATLIPISPEDFNVGPRDQQQIEQGDDVLCYTTISLSHPIEVTGPIELVLYIASSTRDTDFTGKLVDVHTDGRAEILANGILRARYRESLSAPVFMEPGQIYELHLNLGQHRMSSKRVIVSAWRSPVATSLVLIATPIQEARLPRRQKRILCRRSTASTTAVLAHLI